MSSGPGGGLLLISLIIGRNWLNSMDFQHKELVDMQSILWPINNSLGKVTRPH